MNRDARSHARVVRPLTHSERVARPISIRISLVTCLTHVCAVQVHADIARVSACIALRHTGGSHLRQRRGMSPRVSRD